MPPRERPPTYRELRLEDIDRAVRDWFDRRVDAHVSDPVAGERRKVPVLFASGERWVTGRDERGVRDKDGMLILPVMTLRRKSVDPVNGMLGLGSNVATLQVARFVSPATSQLANLDQSRPLSQRRLRQSAVYDIHTVPFPFNGIVSYEVVVQAQYITQVNAITEKFISRLEFYDVPTFVVPVPYRPMEGERGGDGQSEVDASEHIPYEARGPLDDYYVVGYLEGDFGEDGNLEEFTDQERIVRTSFTFRVPTALTLDPEGTRPAAQVVRTAFGLTLGEERIVRFDSQEELDAFFEDGRLTSVDEVDPDRRR